jgi:hypothetical protein
VELDKKDLERQADALLYYMDPDLPKAAIIYEIFVFDDAHGETKKTIVDILKI